MLTESEEWLRFLSEHVRCTDQIAPIRHSNISRTDQIDNIWAHSRRREVFWLLVGSAFRNFARWYHIWSAWLPCIPPKTSKNPRNKSLFSPSSQIHRMNPFSYIIARSLAPVWVDGSAKLGILSHCMFVGRLEEHGVR